MRNIKTYLRAVAVAALCSACTPDRLPDSYDGSYMDIGSLPHGMIVLGDRQNDPYALETMQAALNSLYGAKAGIERLDVTDYYVRFLPRDDAQFGLLRDLGLELVDHPLDYRIVREGDYYHDPSVEEGSITWQYAVVDNDFVFPDGIVHEVLDRCYIPEHADTKSPGIDWDAVEKQAYVLSGNADMLEPETKAASGSPRGRICIRDDDYCGGEPVGVSGVKVVANTFVKFASAYTDESGSYYIDRSFSSSPRYRLMFQNSKGFAIGVNLLLVPASVSTMGNGPSEGMDVLITKESDRKLYTRCVANNAAFDYYERCSREDVNITTPPANLRIWLFQNIGSSSAPMLQQGAFIDGTVLGSFLGEYASIVKTFLPDITIGVENLEDYDSIYNLVQHELAHASHFTRVGKQYWDKYIAFVLKSFVTSGFRTYGVGTEENAGYCEVGEMWAFYMQNVLYRERYGVYPPNLGSNYWFSPQIFLYLDDRGLGDSSLFAALGPGVIDRESLKEALLELYPNNRYIIVQAFNRYFK